MIKTDLTLWGVQKKTATESGYSTAKKARVQATLVVMVGGVTFFFKKWFIWVILKLLSYFHCRLYLVGLDGNFLTDSF